MKKIILLTFLLMSTICYGQNIRDNFSDALGAKWRIFLNQGDASATFDRNTDSTISPVNSLGVGYYGGRFYDTTMNTGSVCIGYVIKQVETGSTARNIYMYLVNDTNMTTMDGYGVRLWESDASSAGTARMQAYKNGSATTIGTADLYGNFVAGDTILFIWYDNDVKTLQIRRASGVIDSTQYNGTTASIGNDTIVNRRPMIRMEVGNQAIKIDDFILSAYPAGGGIEPPPQPAGDTTVPVVETYAVTPASWDTSTTGVMTVRVTDNSVVGLDSFKVRWNGVDSIIINVTNSNDTTLYWSISKKAAGTYTYNVWVRDTAGNETTSSNKSLSVGVGHQFKGVVAYYTLDRLTDPSTATKLSPRDVDFSGITHLVWFPAQSLISTAFPYFDCVYNEPPINSTTDTRIKNDYDLETANPFSGQTKRFRQWTRDSLNRYGHKMLLCVGGAGSDLASFEIVFADSAKTQTFVDSSVAYMVLRGYNGISINYEFPTNPTYYARLLRIYRNKLNTLNPVGILENCVYRSAAEIGGYAGIASLITQYADITTPMSYGYGQYSGIFGHNTGLYAAGCYGSYNSYITDPATGIVNWAANGADTSKMAGCFSFEMKSTTQLTVGLCETKTASTTYAYYQTVVTALNLPTTNYYFDPDAKVPYAIYPSGSNQVFFSYDNPQSIYEKGQYYKDKKFGYLWIWDLARGHLFDTTGGHVHDELLQAVFDVAGSIIDTSTKAPDAPVLVSPLNNAVDIEKDSTVLIWNTSTNASNYQVQVATSNLFSNIVFQAYPIDTSIIIPNNTLDYYITYYWRVSAASTIYGSWSTVQSFTTKNQDTFYVAVTVPVLVAPTANATEQTVPLSFRWNNIPTATTYQIIITADTSGSINIADQSLTDTAYIHLSSFTYSTAYWWKVRSMNTLDTSAYSGWRKFTYQTAPVVIPSEVGTILKENPSGKKSSVSMDFFESIPFCLPSSISVTNLDTVQIRLFVNSLNGKLQYKKRTSMTDEVGTVYNIDGTLP